MKIFKCDRNVYVHCAAVLWIYIYIKLMKLHTLDVQLIVHYLYFKVVKKMITMQMIENVLKPTKIL